MIEHKEWDFRISGAGCFSEIEAKAPSVASDAMKEHEWCGSSSECAKCGVSDLSGVDDDMAYYEAADKAQYALDSLVGAYAAANAMLIGLREDNKKLMERVENLREQVAELMDESRELAELKRKLRGLLNES